MTALDRAILQAQRSIAMNRFSCRPASASRRSALRQTSTPSGRRALSGQGIEPSCFRRPRSQRQEIAKRWPFLLRSGAGDGNRFLSERNHSNQSLACRSGCRKWSPRWFPGKLQGSGYIVSASTATNIVHTNLGPFGAGSSGPCIVCVCVGCFRLCSNDCCWLMATTFSLLFANV